MAKTKIAVADYDLVNAVGDRAEGTWRPGGVTATTNLYWHSRDALRDRDARQLAND
jgi:hypothetical protein